MKYSIDSLTNFANKLLNSKAQFEKLKQIGNRSNYKLKVQKLKQRLTDELKFWMAKGPSPRLRDIERDIKYVSTLTNKTEFTDQEKEKLDMLVKKHPIDQL
jgi:hypothetical protein